MSCYKWTVLTMCAATLVSIAPRTAAVPSGLLAQWAGRSICEAVVEYDEDPDRIPRTIKVVKCAATPDKMCTTSDGAQKSCCTQNSYANNDFSCREIIDSVMVRYEAGAAEPTLKTVSVGCACVMEQHLTAQEV